MVAGLALVVAIAAWRLGEGPVSLSFLTPEIEDSLSRPDGSVLVDVDETVLVWAGWERALEIRAVGVRVLGGERLLAEAPEMSVSFSLVALATGRVQPRWVEVIGPQITVMRATDGRIDFGLGGGSLGGEITDPEAVLGDWLEGGPGGDDPLAALGRVSVVAADMVVDDRMLDRTWIATGVSVDIGRQDGRIGGWMEAMLETGSAPMVATGTFYYGPSDRSVDIDLDLSVPRPDVLADLVPGIPGLAGVAVPVDLKALARISASGIVRTAHLSLTSAAGHVDLSPLGIGQTVAVTDGRVGAVLAHPVPVTDLLSTGPDPWTLDAALVLKIPSPPGRPVSVSLALRDAGPGAAPVVDLDIDRLDPARVVAAHPWLVEHLSPGLSAGPPVGPPVGTVLPAIAMPVRLTGTATLSEAWEPLRITATLAAGAGTVTLAGRDPAPIDRLTATGTYDVTIGAGSLSDLSADLLGGSLSVSADLLPGDDGRVLKVVASLTDLPIDALATYWPDDASPNARRWITANVENGRVDRADVKIDGLIGASGFAVSDLDGRMALSGATVHYARPLQPIRQAATDLVFDLDSFNFDFTAGRIAGIHIRDGTMRIAGIQIAEETAAINVVADGPLSDILEVLNHPTLGYADRFGIVPGQAGGRAVAAIRFDFPLLDALTIDRIAIDVDAELSDVDLPDMVAGQPIGNGDLRLTLDNAGMRLAGTATLGLSPVTLEMLENFGDLRQDAPYQSLYKMQAVVDAAAVRHFGLDPRPWLDGPLGIDLTYTVASRQTAQIDIGVDITGARASLPRNLWDKPAGVDGHIGLALLFPDRRLTAIPRIDVVSDGLVINGSIGFSDAGAPSEVLATRIALGRTEIGPARVQMLDGHLDIELTGQALDLGPILAPDALPPDADSSGAQPSDAKPSDGLPPGGLLPGGLPPDGLPPRGLLADVDLEPALPWTLAVQATVERLYLSRSGAPLRDLVLDVGHDRRQWRYITLHGHTTGGGKIRLDHDLDAFTEQQRPYLVRFAAHDFGALLAAADATRSFRGGTAVLEGRHIGQGADRRLAGTFFLRDYGVRDAPFIAHLLDVASLTGIVGILSSDDGLHLEGLETDFVYQNKRMTLTNGRAWNAGIGLTAEGRLDLERDRLDIDGTIAPLNIVNLGIGLVPGVRDLLTPNNEGLFAARFELTGDLADPDVSVNPLSIVTPGPLRRFFDLFDDDPVHGPQPAQRP